MNLRQTTAMLALAIAASGCGLLAAAPVQLEDAQRGQELVDKAEEQVRKLEQQQQDRIDELSEIR